jgi:hypothetical protein
LQTYQIILIKTKFEVFREVKTALECKMEKNYEGAAVMLSYK